MNSLREYVGWVGDLSFDVRPFCDVDALILCQASYFDLKATMASTENPVLSDVLPFIEQGLATLQITGDDFGNAAIFRATCSSKRFGSLKISNYVDRIEPEKSLQFCAVTFTLPGQWSFIAYRGTDNTLTGWKEDCLISVEKTLAQELALTYAMETMQDDSLRYYIGGHSKGGNLALYAACMLNETAFSRLEHAYLLDGPGMSEEILPAERLAAADCKLTRIIPEYDLVGMIYAPAVTDTKVIHSSQTALLQHSLATWCTDCGGLSLAEKTDPAATYLNEALDDWLRDSTTEQRKACFTELFDALAAEGFTTVDDISDAEAFQAVLIRFAGISPATRRTLEDIPKKVIFGSPTIEPPKKLTDRIRDLFSHTYFKAFFLIALGAVVMLLPTYAMELVVEIAFILLAGWSCYTTLRRLKLRKWHIYGSRERIVISISLLVLCVVLVVKESALFILSSMLMGAMGIFTAIQCGGSAIKKRDDIPGRVLSILETIIAAGFGIAFLIIPQSLLATFYLAIAITLAADGLTRVIIALVRLLIKKKRLAARQSVKKPAA